MFASERNFLVVFFPGTISTAGNKYAGLNGCPIMPRWGFLHLEKILEGKSPDELEEIITFDFTYLEIFGLNQF